MNKLKLNIKDADTFKNRPRLDSETIIKWTEALRSGRYKQGKGHLQFAGCFCCLGVLCEVLEIKSVLDNGIHNYQGLDHCLAEENKLFSELGSLGKFKGFSLKLFDDDDNYSYIHYQSLASLNDSLDSNGIFEYSFVVISKIIETFWGPENPETWEIEV